MNKDDKLLINNIINGMQEKKAKKIALVDMTGLEAPCQYFVICEGTSVTHIVAIADEVRNYVRKNYGQKPFLVDGYDNAEWIAMDYCQVIVHIFMSSPREFYDIEHLWHDAKIQWFEDIN
jgi:ribosome-associated protein